MRAQANKPPEQIQWPLYMPCPSCEARVNSDQGFSKDGEVTHPGKLSYLYECPKCGASWLMF